MGKLGLVERQIDAGVRIVRMVDPSDFNQLGPAMVQRLSQELLKSSDPCVLAGTQDVFSVGRLRPSKAEFSSGAAEQFLHSLRDRRPGFVTAVEGPAIGWGLALVLCGRVRIGLSTSSFSAGTWDGIESPLARVLLPLLEDAIGHQRKNYLVLAGGSIDGTTAAEWGLLDRVVVEGSLQQEAVSAARSIVETDHGVGEE